MPQLKWSTAQSFSIRIQQPREVREGQPTYSEAGPRRQFGVLSVAFD